jgi:hypothetical protein
MIERMEARDCNNHIYLKNLVESLEEARVRKDIERIILYASELERYKIICGNSPVIQQFEASMRRVSGELGLANYPAIERAMNAHPEHMCQCRDCEQSAPTQHRAMGFAAMFDAAFGVVERSLEEEQPNIKREAPVRCGMGGFGEMLEESRRGSERSVEKDEDDVKPIVRGWGMGFESMLDAAAYGNVERSFQPKEDDEAPIRSDGFLGQLEDTVRGTPESRVRMRIRR